MSKALRKREHSHFAEKVNLRLDALPDKESIKVLDCFAGKGRLWKKIREERPDRKITVVGIDKMGQKGTTLKGNNLKYLGGMNLNKFDIVDLDAYGIPFAQLAVIFEKGFQGRVVLTWIQSIWGRLPKRFLYALDYTRQMVGKCPTLFNRHGFEKLKQYLAKNGIRQIKTISFGQKHYLWFEMPKTLDRSGLYDIINNREGQKCH